MKEQRKQICIIGLGQFGSALARALAPECEVLALDTSSDRVNAIADHVQRALVVDARDFSSLSSVVTPDYYEAVVCIGERMEASVLSTLHLKKVGVPRIQAKANNEDHAAILRGVGATEIIFPERETAHRVAARILNPNLVEFLPLEKGYEVSEIEAPQEFHDRTLEDLDLRRERGVFVVAVRENESGNLEFLPASTFVIRPGDLLVMIGRRKDVARLREEAAKRKGQKG